MASTDDMLCRVADALSDDDQIERLGKELGFHVPQITRYKQSNHVGGHVTSQGTRKMLRDWSEKVPTAETPSRLKTALMNVKLVRIAEKVEAGGRPRGLLPQLETELNEFEKELKRFYLEEFEEISTSPFDSMYTQIEHIYVNLLLKEQTREESKQLEYEKFIEILKHEHRRSRTILIGEAGVGKTTLLSKIAYDWAKGKHLQDIQFLFLATLRENEDQYLFGDIFIRKLSDELNIEGERVDEYIRTNQQKVILLLDGLDEYRGDITTDKSAIAQVVRGQKFKRVQVVVTTRPWRAGDITSTEKMNKMYLKIDVLGFKPSDVEDYAKKFFTHEPAVAQSLIEFMKANHVCLNMAPFPIFCSMLCHVWKEESRRHAMKKLETFSQLIGEMMYSLVEHYCSKEKDRTGLILEDCQEECHRAFQQVGKLAFRGLQEKHLLFHDDDITECAEAFSTVHKVGVLSQKKRKVPREVRRKTGKENQTETQFSHKLLQEYLAGCYVASLHQSDPAEFRRLLEQNVLVKYEEFKYFLYFLAAQDNGSGRTMMESLCRTVKDERFIMDVAFESHDKNIIEPVVEYLRQRTCLTLQLNNRHSVLAFMYSLTAFIHKKQYEGTFPQVYDTSVADDDPIAFQCEGAMGLMTLPNMRSLNINDLGIISLHDSFYKGIINAGHHSLITSLSISDSCTMTRSKMGILLSLPCLKSLNLEDICTNESDANRGHHTVASQLENLSTSGVNFGTIHILGLLLMCPGVKQLILSKMREVTCEQAVLSMDRLKSSCRKLVELSITETVLGNKGVCKILQTLKDHEHLKTVRIQYCGTDSALDSVCEEINRGGRMQVFPKHGQVRPTQEIPGPLRRTLESFANDGVPRLVIYMES